MAAARLVTRLRGALALIGALLVAYYALTPDGIYGAKAQGDGFFSFHYLPSIVVFRTLDMRHALPRDLERMDTGPRGHKLNRAPIGPALAMLPLYCAGEGLKHVAVKALVGLGRDPRVLGPPPFEPHTGQMFYTGLVSLFAAILGMVVVFRLLRRHTGEAAAVVGAAASVLCTQVAWYATIQPHYQHALAFAATALFIERWEHGLARGDLSVGRFARLGLLGGLAMLMRAQEAVFLLAPGVELLYALFSSLRRRDRSRDWAGAGRVLLCGAVLAAGAVVAFLPQILVWATYFGWFKRPFNIEPMRFAEPAIAEVLFSMRAGLFPWTPLAYLGIVGLGLGLGLRRSSAVPASTRITILGAGCVILADVYLVASSWAWHGTFSFGARRLSDLAVFFALGTALLLDYGVRCLRPGAGRRILTSLVGAALIGCFVFNTALIELWRRRVLPNSAKEARSASAWVEHTGGPAWLVRALRLGYPLVQPMGWAFALWHRAPATAWESVAGSYLAERNEHDFAPEGTEWSFGSGGSGLKLIAAGSQGSSGADGLKVEGELRLLLQPFGREPLDLTLEGQLPDGEIEVRWDGAVLPVIRDAGALRILVPIERVRAHRVSELALRLPAAGVLTRLRVRVTSSWWRPPAR